MPTKKSSKSSKKKSSTPVKKQKVTRFHAARGRMAALYAYLTRRRKNFLTRRPHRSFRRTRRRDYTRSLKLPGYWAFTNYVRKTLWQNRTLFVWLMLFYGAVTVLLVGMASQDTYSQLNEVIRSTSGDIFKGSWGALGQASLALATGVTGSLGTSLTEVQQVYAVIIGLFMWLTTVWLLRAALAGPRPRLRDALYNAGGPIIPSFLVALFLVIQLVPVALAVIGFTALLPYGILDGGVEAMLFWTCALLLLGLSLYWITSTLVALVIVTLPGMYPLKAMQAAGDMVAGRRVRILLRLLWLFFIVILLWLVVMIPLILLDTWIKSMWPAITWLPIVPVALLIMGAVTTVWVASYVYLLYRKVVDDDAAPA